MPEVEIGEATLHYETAGDASADPRTLVFVHGGWVSSRMWAPQVERFGGDRRVVTVDVRGHGDSDGANGGFSVDRFAADLRAVLERADVADPVLCGLSLGGLVVQEYATRYDVGGLVLADTTRTVPPIPLTKLQKLALAPKPLVHAAVRTMGPRAYFESLLAGVRAVEGHRWVALDPDVRRYVREELDRFDPDGFVAVLDACYDHRPADLAAIDAPALLVHGDHEASTVVRQNREMADALDAPREVVPDAGHLANLDNPAAFDDAVESFLGAA